MKRVRFFFLLLWLPLVVLMTGGCRDKVPSAKPESSNSPNSPNPPNSIIPPVASGASDAPKETATLQLHPVGGAPPPAQTTDPMAVIQQARERVNKNPKDVDALIFLANANFDIGRYQEAADLYQKALELNSDNAQVRTDRATALYRLGRSKEAIEELNMALASDYHHETALYNMGIIKLAAFNDREGAIAAWTQLKDITQDQKLIAELDTRIADARRPSSSKTDGKTAGKPARPAPAGQPGTLQLPAPSGQAK